MNQKNKELINEIDEIRLKIKLHMVTQELDWLVNPPKPNVIIPKKTSWWKI